MSYFSNIDRVIYSLYSAEVGNLLVLKSQVCARDFHDFKPLCNALFVDFDHQISWEACICNHVHTGQKLVKSMRSSWLGKYMKLNFAACSHIWATVVFDMVRRCQYVCMSLFSTRIDEHTTKYNSQNITVS